jgi:hypothetical protein
MAPEMNSAVALANRIAEVRGDFIRTVNHTNT